MSIFDSHDVNNHAAKGCSAFKVSYIQVSMHGVQARVGSGWAAAATASPSFLGKLLMPGMTKSVTLS